MTREEIAVILDYLITLVCFLFVVIRYKINLCSSDCPGSHWVGQARLELGEPFASACQMLELNVFTITPGRLAVRILHFSLEIR